MKRFKQTAEGNATLKYVTFAIFSIIGVDFGRDIAIMLLFRTDRGALPVAKYDPVGSLVVAIAAAGLVVSVLEVMATSWFGVRRGLLLLLGLFCGYRWIFYDRARYISTPTVG